MVKRGYFKANEEKQGRRIYSALVRSGIERSEIFFDRSGHMQFHLLQSKLNPGDTLVIHRIGEICDTIDELFCFISWLRYKQVDLVSLKEPWLRLGAEIPQGQALILLIERLYRLQQNKEIHHPAQFISAENSPELDRDGHSRMSGSQRAKFDAALAMYQKSELSVREICRHMEINERTFYRYLKKNKSGVPLRTDLKKHN